MADFVKVAILAEIQENQGKLVSVNGTEVALYKVGACIYALRNICPHKGGPLGEGEIQGSVVTCPWHGWEFDLADAGKCTMNEIIEAKMYPVKQEGDAVLIEI
ncbi:MAG: Rieske 2Fe-2S domain-containing protein [Nitrospirae bacterium]|nr:Rieske 2Fe-2S domain-containing protein [Nitrospirota bacterium]